MHYYRSRFFLHGGDCLGAQPLPWEWIREKRMERKKQHNNMLQCKCISVPAFGPTQCATKVRAHVRFMTFCQWYLGGFGCFLSLFTSQPLLASIYALPGHVHLFHMPVFFPPLVPRSNIIIHRSGRSLVFVAPLQECAEERL